MRSSKSRSRSKQNRPRSLGNIINRVFDSSGPEGKVRGTPQQIIEKYQLLARDAQLSNDRVAAENFLQHAEHYTRLLSEAQREMAAEQEARQQQYQQNGNQNGNQNGYGRDQNRDTRNWRDERGDPGAGDQPDLGEVIDPRGDDSGLVETPEFVRRDEAPRQDYRSDRQHDRQHDRSGERSNDRRTERGDRGDSRRNDRSDDRSNDRRNDRGDRDSRSDNRNDQRRDDRKERGPRPPRAERSYDDKPTDAVAVVETVTIEPVKVEAVAIEAVKLDAPKAEVAKVQAPKAVAPEAAAEAVQSAAKPARAPRQASVVALADEGEQPKPKAKRTRKPKAEGDAAPVQEAGDSVE